VVSGKKDKHAADFYIYNQLKPDSVQDYSLVSVVKTVHTWRKPLLAITLAVAILTVIVSLFLPNYYKSTTVFYAASQDLFKPQKVFGYSQAEMYYYGGSEDIQRAITASTSFPVVDHLISEFNLYEHYGIKATSPKATFKVRERLMEHYQVVRTKYDALELSVEDRDPEIAARMANSARQKLNNVLSGIIKSSQRDLISTVRCLDKRDAAERIRRHRRHAADGDVGTDTNRAPRPVRSKRRYTLPTVDARRARRIETSCAPAPASSVTTKPSRTAGAPRTT
jgi:capsular polysaccharide biosynthesis protein